MIGFAAGCTAMLGAALFALETQKKPPADYSGNCTDAGCHADLTKQPVVHAPVDSGSCDSCHESTDAAAHKFRLTSEGASLCTQCHDGLSKKVQHAPAAEGECTTCHNPHSSKVKDLLQADSVAALCQQCHDVTADRAFRHGPVAAGACTTCHNPHESDEPNLLSAPIVKLCGQCHQDMQTRLAEKKYTHAPVQEDCTDCHDPHGANHPMMITAEPPILCFSCHDDISDTIDKASVRHDAVTKGKACAGCHAVHASDHSNLLLADSMDVCLTCHDNAVEAPSGKLAGLKALLAKNPVHHGPINDRDCTTCHAEVHGGARFRLLAADYPSHFYAPYSEERYALCFGCHDAEAFAEAHTDKLTGFRNGDQNLHFLHVNRKVKGRSCRACHQVHAGKQPQLIAESVPFGQWRIPLGFEATATGGSCHPGCHRPFRYDRKSKVENIVPTTAPAPSEPS
jgi:predicted CXXCH cytochrome family protein